MGSLKKQGDSVNQTNNNREIRIDTNPRLFQKYLLGLKIQRFEDVLTFDILHFTFYNDSGWMKYKKVAAFLWFSSGLSSL